MVDVDRLVAHYETLIGYYREMGELTHGITEKLEAGGKLTGVAPLLNKKKGVVDSIEQVSRDIAEYKKSLKEEHTISESDAVLIRDVEIRLTSMVNRFIDENSKMYDLMMKQGVKVRGR